jgi:hypothetical protein
MKSSALANRSFLAHASTVMVTLTLGLFAVGTGCVGGGDGDRCNPLLSHDECNDGLTCVQPSTCVESYCCPSDPSKSTSPFCRGDPGACPAPEAGADASGAGDASTDGGGADGDGAVESGTDAPIDVTPSG